MNWGRGWEALDIFKGFLKFSLAYLLWCSTLRALLFYAVFRQWLGWHDDVVMALLVGARFDLLVLAFFWIPVWLVTWLWALRLLLPTLSTLRIYGFWKNYFTLVIFLSAFFIAFDFFFSAAHQSRINHEIWNYNWLKIVNDGFSKMGMVNAAVVALWIGVTTKWMKTYLNRSEMLQRPVALPANPAVFILQILGTLLVIALCARGTITPHHLNREHTEVSPNAIVNQLPINPIWGLDN